MKYYGIVVYLIPLFTIVCCSVGGADYGSVRIGTFMGRKMIKSMASERLYSSVSSRNSQKVEGINNDETDEKGMDLLEAEAAMDYLCNLSPHRLFLLLFFVLI